MRAKFLIVLPLLAIAALSAVVGQELPGNDFRPTSQEPKTDLPGTPGSIRLPLARDPRASTEDSPGALLANKDQQIEGQVRELLAQLRTTTDDPQRTKIEGEVKALLRSQFEARQALRSMEIARLEEQVKKLRTVHDERNKQGERIIEDHLQFLLRNAQGLGWGGEPEAGRQGLSSDGRKLLKSNQSRFAPPDAIQTR